MPLLLLQTAGDAVRPGKQSASTGALELRHEGHRGQPTVLNNIPLCFSSLFEQQGLSPTLYILTLTTLVRARQNHLSDPTRIPEFLAVPVARSPAGSNKGVYSTFTPLKDEDATVSKIAENYRETSSFTLPAMRGQTLRTRSSPPCFLVTVIWKSRISCNMIWSAHDLPISLLARLLLVMSRVLDKAIHLAAVTQFTGFQLVTDDMVCDGQRRGPGSVKILRQHARRLWSS